MCRISSDHGRRPLDVDAGQFGSALEKRFSRQVDAGCDGAAQVISAPGDGIEGRGCPKIDHAGWSAISVEDRHCVSHPVSADRARVFIADVDSSLDTGVHHERLLVQVLAASLLDAPRQRRHHRGQADTCQVSRSHTCVFEQTQELQAIFIRHALVVGCQAPVRADLLARVQPEGQVGIADVDRQ